MSQLSSLRRRQWLHTKPLAGNTNSLIDVLAEAVRHAENDFVNPTRPILRPPLPDMLTAPLKIPVPVAVPPPPPSRNQPPPPPTTCAPTRGRSRSAKAQLCEEHALIEAYMKKIDQKERSLIKPPSFLNILQSAESLKTARIALKQNGIARQAQMKGTKKNPPPRGRTSLSICSRSVSLPVPG